MPTPPVPPHKLQETADLIAYHGNSSRAAKASGIPQGTLNSRHAMAEAKGIKSKIKSTEAADQVHLLERQIKNLKAELRDRERTEFAAADIKEKLFKVSQIEPKTPDWVIKPKAQSKNTPGTPTLFCSDWHWGEVVDPAEIAFKNAFNIRIAKERVRSLVDNTIDMLFNVPWGIPDALAARLELP